MARPWETLETVDTDEGPLELRRRGPRDFLIVIDGRVLMNSLAHRSELDVARLACARIADRPGARVLIGGLGMGFTLRAALDDLGPDAAVAVAELTPAVERWCRGPMAEMIDHALDDPRAEVLIGDVSRVIASAPRQGGYDAIVLDLYEGPHEAVTGRDDPFYGRRALARTREALRPGGVFTVWSEERDGAFERRLERAGFEFEWVRSGKGGRRHPVYVATAITRSKSSSGR